MGTSHGRGEGGGGKRRGGERSRLSSETPRFLGVIHSSTLKEWKGTAIRVHTTTDRTECGHHTGILLEARASLIKTVVQCKSYQDIVVCAVGRRFLGRTV